MDNTINLEHEKQEIIELIQKSQDAYTIKMLNVFIKKLLRAK